MADLEEQKNDASDKHSDKVAGKLAAGNTEADVAAHRAAINANPNKINTVSPEGSKSEPFGITDGGKVIASKDVKSSGSMPEARERQNELQPAIKTESNPAQDQLNDRQSPTPEESIARVSVDALSLISKSSFVIPPRLGAETREGSTDDPTNTSHTTDNRLLKGNVRFDEPITELKAAISPQHMKLQHTSADIDRNKSLEPPRGQPAHPNEREHERVAQHTEHTHATSSHKAEHLPQSTEHKIPAEQDQHQAREHHHETPPPAHDEQPQAHKPELNITKGIQNLDDVRDLGQGIVKGLGNAASEALNYIATRNSVENSLLSIGPALDSSVDYYGQTNPKQFMHDAGTFAEAGQQATNDKLGHLMSQADIGEAAGMTMPTFFVPIAKSEVLKAKDLEALGGVEKLEKLSKEELEALGVKRFDMPRLKLEHDEYSIKASVHGHPGTHFRAEVKAPGVIHATDLYGGTLPKGTGSDFFAQALKAHDAMPAKQLVIKNIVNPETLNAFKAGAAPQETLAGKCATKALKQLELTPSSYKYEVVHGKLNIIIDMAGKQQ